MKTKPTSSPKAIAFKMFCFLFLFFAIKTSTTVAQSVTCNAHFSSYRTYGNASEVHFNAAYNANAVSYAWDFSDGATATTRSAVHTFALPGNYNVCLTVHDSSAGGVCTSTHCDTIRILPP